MRRRRRSITAICNVCVRHRPCCVFFITTVLRLAVVSTTLIITRPITKSRRQTNWQAQPNWHIMKHILLRLPQTVNSDRSVQKVAVGVHKPSSEQREFGY